MNVKNAMLCLVLCAGCLALAKAEAAEAAKMSLDDCKAVLEKLKTEGKLKQYKLDPSGSQGLLKLDLSHSGITDLTPLKGMPITSLHIDGDDADPAMVATLAGLEGMPLHELTVWGSDVLENLGAIQGSPLNTLHIGGTKHGKSKLKDISALKGLDLHELWLGFPLEDISPLAGMKLNSLWLFSPTKDVNALKGMPLAGAWLASGALTDISGLQGSQLKSLSLHGSSKLMDLTPLKGVPLESLDLSYCQMESLHGLEGMPLKGFMVPPNVSDLTPLKDMPALESISFEGKKVTDFTPLKTIKTLKQIGGVPAADFWKKYDEGKK